MEINSVVFNLQLRLFILKISFLSVVIVSKFAAYITPMNKPALHFLISLHTEFLQK